MEQTEAQDTRDGVFDGQVELYAKVRAPNRMICTQSPRWTVFQVCLLHGHTVKAHTAQKDALVSEISAPSAS